jgi:L-ascorbate metabolism protein UlaG (beta-lactamase superfamily)
MRPGSRLSLLFAAAITVALVALSAPVAAASMVQAQPDAKPEANRTCAGLVAARPRPVPAAFELTALGADQVRITYVGHATFLIESPQLVRIATDYNDFVRPPLPPDIITMNHAHSTHYTNHPDPGIKYVLRGWRDDGGPAGHDLTFKDVHVRSVSTNIRDWAGGTERYGNSIFVFEIANLCIAHLGHLHHTLTPQQLDEIGRVDVVMAPVDGSFTLDLDGMVEVLQSLKPQLIIPMHFFSTYTLDRFLARMRQSYPIEHNEIPAIVVSRATLPASPTVVVLPGH